MALLESTPHIVITTEQTNLWDTGANYAYHQDKVKTVTWAATKDPSGEEATHEATYGVGGYRLEWAGYVNAAHGTPGGCLWVEKYRKRGAYTVG